MTAATLRKKVHQYVDDMDENVLDVVYRMLKLYKEEESASVMTKEQKIELDRTLTEHKAGKLKYYTLNEAKRVLYKDNPR